jgi:phenylalanine-4-hydroxylase
MTGGRAALPGNQRPSGSQAGERPASSDEELPRPDTRERVPAHLRHLVVEQAYDAYNSVDQAVWRFVLTQIFDTLRHTAHPAYESGLAETGISTERIPRIEEMDRCLARYGWGAVCVDGFIPPRAFVEFQALGILPIAADMRTVPHLVYTPAPDIIHEAAGHAPILPDARYAAFLRRIGSVGAAAFSSKEDERVYRAIYTLSEVKERPNATETEIARAERTFEEAAEGVTRVSEATRMSRLYWWTAEYGLVGTVKDYRLFGAGLLSSLGESYSCHDVSVKKVPLSATCTEVAYDITRAQPQLFVARDFDHLEEVLSAVESTLSAQRGGTDALREAVSSEEVATLRISEPDGSCAVGVIGIVEGFEAEPGAALDRIRLRGPLGITVSESLAALGRPEALPDRAELFVGRGDPAWRTKTYRFGDQATIDVGAGARLVGRVALIVRSDDASEPALLLGLQEAHLGGSALPGFTLVTMGQVTSVRAGAVDLAFYPASSYSSLRVPGNRTFTAEQKALIELHDEARTLWGASWGTSAERVVSHLLDELNRRHPDEWLLRHHLLEALLRAGQQGVAAELQAELERMEVRFAHREPIALGLRRLARLTA